MLEPTRRIMSAAIELAHDELKGRRLSPDEKTILDVCDDIAMVRETARADASNGRLDSHLPDLEERIARGEVTACRMSPRQQAEHEERQRFWDELGEESQDPSGLDES